MKLIPLHRNQFTNLLLNQRRNQESNNYSQCHCDPSFNQGNCECSQINIGLLLHPSSQTSVHDFSFDSFLNQFSSQLLSKLPHGKSVNIIGIAIVMPNIELNNEGENAFLSEFWKFLPPNQYRTNHHSKRLLISLPGDGNSLWFHLSPFLSSPLSTFPSKL